MAKCKSSQDSLDICTETWQEPSSTENSGCWVEVIIQFQNMKNFVIRYIWTFWFFKSRAVPFGNFQVELELRNQAAPHMQA